MKKIISILALAFAVAANAQKVSELTESTTAGATDLILITKLSGTNFVSRKITVGNLHKILQDALDENSSSALRTHILDATNQLRTNLIDLLHFTLDNAPLAATGANLVLQGTGAGTNLTISPLGDTPEIRFENADSEVQAFLNDGSINSNKLNSATISWLLGLGGGSSDIFHPVQFMTNASGQICINTNSPQVTNFVMVGTDGATHTNGGTVFGGFDIRTGGLSLGVVRRVTANTVVLPASDSTIEVNSSVNRTVTLTNCSPGKIYFVKAVGAGGVVLVDGNGKTIDGNASVTFSSQNSLLVQGSSTTNWNVLGGLYSGLFYDAPIMQDATFTTAFAETNEIVVTADATISGSVQRVLANASSNIVLTLAETNVNKTQFVFNLTTNSVEIQRAGSDVFSDGNTNYFLPTNSIGARVGITWSQTGILLAQ